jgi:hypothetical protein
MIPLDNAYYEGSAQSAKFTLMLPVTDTSVPVSSFP